MSRLIALYGGKGELAVEGTSQALATLAAGLREASPVVELPLNLPSAREIGAYSGFLTTIRISTVDQPVEVLRDGFVLQIRGSRSKLGLVASNIESLITSEEVVPTRGRIPPHLHMEFYPGHFFLHPDSEPLVIQLSKE